MATATAVAPVVVSGAAAAQQSQAALVTLLATALGSAWDLLDTNNLDGTLPNFITAVAALVTRYGQGSATTASLFYKAERQAAGIPGPIRVTVAKPPSIQEVNDSVRWATKGLWSSDPNYADQNMTAAKTLVQGVAETAVLDTGRQTIVNAVQNDSQAKGWAREAEPGCCAFCALLTTRGMTYRSEHTADFKAHNACRCHATPVFTAYEPSAQVRDWKALYQSSTKGARGMDATIAAYRAAYDAKYLASPAAEPAKELVAV